MQVFQEVKKNLLRILVRNRHRRDNSAVAGVGAQEEQPLGKQNER